MILIQRRSNRDGMVVFRLLIVVAELKPIFPKLAQKGFGISQLSEMENKKWSSCLDVKQEKRSFVGEKNEKNRKNVKIPKLIHEGANF